MNKEPYFKKKCRRWCITGEEETSLFNLFFYVLFIASTFYFAIMQKQPSPDSFYFTSAIVDHIIDAEFYPSDSHVLKTFRDIKETADVWKFLNGPFSKIFKDCKNATLLNCHAQIQTNTYLIDPIILTQVRVKSTPINTGRCVFPKIVGKDFIDANSECFFEYDPDDVDDRPTFNASAVPADILDCYTLKPSSFGHSWGGYFNLDYGHVGYACLGDKVGPRFREKLLQLKEHRWVDAGTRAIYMDMTVFNPTVRLFLTLNIGFEYLAAGSVMPYFSTNVFQSTETPRNQTSRMFAFVLFYIFVSCYSIKSFLNCYGQQCRVSTCSFCKITDSLTYMMRIVIAMLFISQSVHEDLALQASNKSDIYAKRTAMQSMSDIDDIIDYMLALDVIVTTGKIFQYLMISKKLSVIIRTMDRASPQLGFSLVTVVTIVIGYAIAFHVAFGSKIQQFRSFGHAFMTCFTSMFVDLELRAELWYSNRILGPFLLISYLVFTSFIVMSLVLAIMDSAFNEVRLEMLSESDEKDPVYIFQENFRKSRRKFTRAVSFSSAEMLDWQDSEMQKKRDLAKAKKRKNKGLRKWAGKEGMALKALAIKERLASRVEKEKGDKNHAKMEQQLENPLRKAKSCFLLPNQPKIDKTGTPQRQSVKKSSSQSI
jgi:hypothetical protein